MKTLDEILSQVTIPIVAVTGTNGKSSVCKMIEEMLVAGGKRVFLAGAEFGPLEKIENCETDFDVAVLELKSSVLQKLPNLKPKIAVLTSLVPAHFERHSTSSDYFEAKKNVFRNQAEEDLLIYCSQSQYARDLVASSQINKIAYDQQSLKKYNLTSLSLKGDHQKLNAIAAIEVARFFKVEDKIIQQALSQLQPLPGRLSFVGEIEGRLIYDDSRAANLLAVIWALHSFSQPVTLVLEAFKVDQELRTQLPLLRNKVQNLFLLGPHRFVFAKEITNFVENYYTLRKWEDVRTIWLKKTKPGEILLFSSGFQNLKHFLSIEEILINIPISL